MSFSICIVDIDTATPWADIVAAAAAFHRQVNEHWWPIWGSSATVRAANAAAPPRAGEVQVQLRKTPTAQQAGALALHDQQNDGTPIAYVFPILCAQYGDSWTSAASHEILELLGDPHLRLCVEMDDGSIWDHEVCDRTQQNLYVIDGVKVSNFNTPWCFEPPNTRTGIKYDYLGLSNVPNQTLPGGYSQKLDPRKGWTMIQVGEMSAYRAAMLSMGLSRGAKRTARSHKSWWRRLLGVVGL